jgi:hypothetical protein
MNSRRRAGILSLFRMVVKAEDDGPVVRWASSTLLNGCPDSRGEPWWNVSRTCKRHGAVKGSVGRPGVAWSPCSRATKGPHAVGAGGSDVPRSHRAFGAVAPRSRFCLDRQRIPAGGRFPRVTGSCTGPRPDADSGVELGPQLPTLAGWSGKRTMRSGLRCARARVRAVVNCRLSSVKLV